MKFHWSLLFSASSYEFFVFCESEDCKENGQLPEWITFNNSITTPSVSGKEETVILYLNSSAPINETISLSLQATSYNGKISEISNRVYVKLGEFSQPPPIVDPDDNKGISQATIRAIVGGSVLGLFILICIAFVVHSSAKKKRAQTPRDIPKSECVNNGFSDSTKDLRNIDSRDGSSKEIDDTRDMSSKQKDDTRNGSSKKRESLPVILYTHDQIRHIKEKTKTPPLYGTNVGPKPWLSLDSLSRRLNEELDSKSENSARTLPADGTDYSAEEVKQNVDTAPTIKVPQERAVKF